MSKQAAEAGTYLAFKVGDETYGLGILRVQEVVALTGITRVPQMTEAVRGVVNLRGRVIPVFDLRVRFGTPVEDTEVTCIIIGQVYYGDQEITIGLIADEVSGVMQISETEIGPVPEFGPGRSADFLTGMATTEAGVVMTLDIDHVMDAEEVMAAEAVA